jgi:hypothetical protein
MGIASNGDTQPHDEAITTLASSSEAPSYEQPYHSSPDRSGDVTLTSPPLDENFAFHRY